MTFIQGANCDVCKEPVRDMLRVTAIKVAKDGDYITRHVCHVCRVPFERAMRAASVDYTVVDNKYLIRGIK